MPTTLITGANRGIGLALVQEFKSRGHEVIATARDIAGATELNATGADVLPLEVTSAESTANLVAALDGRPIDYAIANAGIGATGTFGELDYDAFRDILEVNTIGPIRTLEALTANVAASDAKMMAAITSRLGSIESSDAGWGLSYRTSKAALNMALRAAAKTVAEDGITVLTLHPGHVRTDMGGGHAPTLPDESAKGLADAILGAAPAKELRFMDFRGEALPW
ncbi:MAG: SDR family oxidoreductase [Pseudomonadota bacterium]